MRGGESAGHGQEPLQPVDELVCRGVLSSRVLKNEISCEAEIACERGVGVEQERAHTCRSLSHGLGFQCLHDIGQHTKGAWCASSLTGAAAKNKIIS